ncbi:hypothetical protein SAMN05428995_105351 [Loktanella sp. DSM 29012]|uniref:Phosphomannomutase n=1 Tax=Loktanella gaetbuli TaxID=2881335 RepID=A0ABS8BSH7_9RHOB|nr:MULTISPECIES: hypothetical protein [Loktanella]KQI68097.1 phosphomannomutase [Loktanella sp. 3ANDIMAR09]MCB5198694.1 hypothetical protein [Loktanella gaetbuli]SEQ62761.1 hypothetical protein SAMN05428995_105351 [Loktanella sp. DSM 29012]
MFTIEHDFDATTVTLVDDAGPPFQEDVIVNTFDDCVTVSQFDPRLGENRTITLSLGQVRDLFAALDLPEGAYALKPAPDKS